MTIQISIIAIVAINVITFFVFGYDKGVAKYNAYKHEKYNNKLTKTKNPSSVKEPTARRRIPEKTLLTLAALGGALGALIGMSVWRHKTQHKKFVYGIPAILVVHIIIFLVFFFKFHE